MCVVKLALFNYFYTANYKNNNFVWVFVVSYLPKISALCFTAKKINYLKASAILAMYLLGIESISKSLRPWQRLRLFQLFQGQVRRGFPALLRELTVNRQLESQPVEATSRPGENKASTKCDIYEVQSCQATQTSV